MLPQNTGTVQGDTGTLAPLSSVSVIVLLSLVHAHTFTVVTSPHCCAVHLTQFCSMPGMYVRLHMCISLPWTLV